MLSQAISSLRTLLGHCERSPYGVGARQKLARGRRLSVYEARLVEDVRRARVVCAEAMVLLERNINNT